MANVQKYTRADVGGGSLTRHYERAMDENGQYHKWGNQEIDSSRSHLNYNLATNHDGGQLTFIGKRLSEVKCHQREDVNIMCSWILTVPKDLSVDDHKQFFRESYDFLRNKYGEKNVISAWVHNDETTPHLHFAFVPVVLDKKKGHEKVSAKEALGWSEKGLHKFHGELDAHMTLVFGRDIGILNEATRDGNRSIEELKQGTAAQEEKRLKSEVNRLIRKQHELQGHLTGLEGIVMAADELQAIQPQKTLTGALKGVSVDDVKNLKKTAMKYHEVKNDLNIWKKKYEDLELSYERTKALVPGVSDRIARAKEIARLKSLENLIARIPREILQQIDSETAMKQRKGIALDL